MVIRKVAMRVVTPAVIAAATLAGTASSASAATLPAPTAEYQAPQATCNYRATVRTNLYAARNRGSRILARFPAGTQFLWQPCRNEPGGWYYSCGGGTLWKPFNRGWLATKCLARI